MQWVGYPVNDDLKERQNKIIFEEITKLKLLNVHCSHKFRDNRAVSLKKRREIRKKRIITWLIQRDVVPFGLGQSRTYYSYVCSCTVNALSSKFKLCSI